MTWVAIKKNLKDLYNSWGVTWTHCRSITYSENFSSGGAAPLSPATWPRRSIRVREGKHLRIPLSSKIPVINNLQSIELN